MFLQKMATRWLTDFRNRVSYYFAEGTLYDTDAYRKAFYDTLKKYHISKQYFEDTFQLDPTKEYYDNLRDWVYKYYEEFDMTLKGLREEIKKRVDIPVRNVFYITKSIDGENIYGINGNNNSVNGIALVYEDENTKDFSIELIV